MFKKLSAVLNRWFQRDRKKKIYDISCVIGCLAGVFLFIAFAFSPFPDTTPYTDAELQQLYNQKDAIATKNYSYEQLKDFNYKIDFYADYYVSTFESDQVRISEYTDYNGNVTKQEISDKKENKAFAIAMHIMVGLIFGCIVMYVTMAILTILYFVFYRFLYKYLFLNFIKFKV
jgi:hypothetical protein